ncbi:MAG: hypothetical protein V1799_07715 [bacterium]
MIKEKILNSFVSSNMQTLGLHHVNSEVPKVVAQHVGKRTDILGFDLATSIPIVLELKVKKDPQVVDQLQEYIALISKKYPNLFEELNAFRHLDGFRFNYRQGIVGMVLSPEPPPNSAADRGSTIVWAQFALHNDEVFKIIDRRILSSSVSLASLFDNRPAFKEVLPAQFVASSLPSLRKFAERLNETYLSVSPTINPRSKHEHSYIAYYGTDTTRVVFGFNTGPTRSTFDVEFSVYEIDHATFRSHPATRKLSSLGLHMDPPRKNQIFPVRIDEKCAGDDSNVSQALALFKEMAQLCYNYAKVPELQTLHIDALSKDALALRNFGLN